MKIESNKRKRMHTHIISTYIYMRVRMHFYKWFVFDVWWVNILFVAGDLVTFQKYLFLTEEMHLVKQTWIDEKRPKKKPNPK